MQSYSKLTCWYDPTSNLIQDTKHWLTLELSQREEHFVFHAQQACAPSSSSLHGHEKQLPVKSAQNHTANLNISSLSTLVFQFAQSLTQFPETLNPLLQHYSRLTNLQVQFEKWSNLLVDDRSSNHMDFEIYPLRSIGGLTNNRDFNMYK